MAWLCSSITGHQPSYRGRCRLLPAGRRREEVPLADTRPPCGLGHGEGAINSMKRLWLAFTLVMVVSFLVLGWIGTRIYHEMPPLPARVVTTEGTVIVDEGE